MLVFSKARLVVLSVPKTGTTAIETALAPHAALVVSDPPELKHAPVYRYNRFFRPMVEKFIAADVDIAAVIREPVSWLGSWYRYRQRDFLDGKPVSTRGISFDAFVQGYLQGKRPDFANVGSQATFLAPRPNGTAITHLFRYEDAERLDRFLEDRLGVALAPERENVSPARSLDLTPQTERKLRRKCADEFELYNSIG